jgi:hypothetical protein
MKRLTFSQANALGSSFAVVEDFVDELRAELLLSHLPRLRRRVNTPEDGQQERVLRILDQIIIEMRGTEKLLGLSPSPVDVAKKIRNQALLFSAELEDVKPQRLANYGAVDPELVPVVEAAVQRLITLLEQL